MARSFSASGYHGDTIALDVTCTRNGSAVNLSGATIWFTAKNLLSDADADAVFQKSTADGIAITDAVNGICRVTIDPADTDALAYEETPLECDVQVKEADGTITTVARGILRIIPDVTRSTT